MSDLTTPGGPPRAETDARTVNGRAAVATLTYLGFTLQLLQVGIIPLLPTIGRELHVAPGATSWLVTAGLLSGAIALAVLTKLADLHGKRPMILLSLVLVLAGCVLGSVTSSFPLLIVSRVLMGALLPMLALPEAVANDTMPPRRAHLTIGAIHAGNGAGVGGGLLLGALVGVHPGAWHVFFYTGTAMTVIGLAATLVFVRDSPFRAEGRLDAAGAVLLAAALSCVLLGLSEGPVWGWGSFAVVALLVAGVALLAGWLLHAGRARHPLIRLSAVIGPDVRVPYLVTFLIAFGIYGSLTAVTRYAQAVPQLTGYGYGYSALRTGWFALPQTLGGIAGAVALQRMGRYRNTAFAAGAGAALITLSFLGYLALHGVPVLMISSLGLSSMGLAIGLAATQLMVLRVVPESESGIALGISVVMYAVGNSFGSDVVGMLFSGMRLPGGLPTQAAFLTSFWLCGGAALLAVLISLWHVRGRSAPSVVRTITEEPV
jgi:MFS family permease